MKFHLPMIFAALLFAAPRPGTSQRHDALGAGDRAGAKKHRRFHENHVKNRSQAGGCPHTHRRTDGNPRNGHDRRHHENAPDSEPSLASGRSGRTETGRLSRDALRACSASQGRRCRAAHARDRSGWQAANRRNQRGSTLLEKPRSLTACQRSAPVPPSRLREPQKLAESPGKRGRVVDCTGLENRQRATVREFESHRFRQAIRPFRFGLT